MEFVGDLYRLGAMGIALSTTYASVCLENPGSDDPLGQVELTPLS